VSQPYLSIRHVAKSYGSVQAVEDISLDISKGEFVSFLGPSGSGKTTTLTMIAGFETPTRGEIFLNGKDLSALRPWQRNIGMVFQNYALFPHMSVARNIAFPLKMRGQSSAEIERRVAEVLRLVGLAAFAERHPRELSGGQQQRVAVARGLVFNPDVLLLDEPLGALDKNLREQMQVELKRIHRDSGTTMIYVTHDQTEAMTMSDRIAVFSQGRLEQIGAPLDVYHRPLTRFVGEFVGDSNFFSARRETVEGPLVVDGIGPIRLPAERLAALGPSTAFDVMVRPERLRLLGAETSGELNTADVKVATLVNYGDSVLVLGEVNQAPVRLRIAGDLPPDCREGEIVKAGWAPQDTHVIARA
jgi:putative spermidine/putrescine transport system ATP-binding protein